MATQIIQAINRVKWIHPIHLTRFFYFGQMNDSSAIQESYKDACNQISNIQAQFHHVSGTCTANPHETYENLRITEAAENWRLARSIKTKHQIST